MKYLNYFFIAGALFACSWFLNANVTHADCWCAYDASNPGTCSCNPGGAWQSGWVAADGTCWQSTHCLNGGSCTGTTYCDGPTGPYNTNVSCNEIGVSDFSLPTTCNGSEGGNGGNGGNGGTCTDTTPVQNQLQGCMYRDTSFNTIYDNAPRGNTSGNIADTFTALDFYWGSDGVKGLSDNYSMRWQGDFTFSGGTYIFLMNADDGFKLFIDGVSVKDQLDKGYNPSTFTYTTNFGLNTTHRIRYDYNNYGAPGITKLWWQKTADLSLPDLVASTAATSATEGTPVTFSATISNTGNAGTGAGFPNRFRVATSNTGSGSVNVSANNTGALAAGGSASVNSSPYTFSSSGIYYYSVCADSDMNGNGVITESDENNNCSVWTPVNVAPAPSVVADLKITGWQDAARSTTYLYANSDGPASLFVTQPYKLTWASSNATSCTLDLGDGAGPKPAALNGSNDTLVAGNGNWSRVHTLSCTNGTETKNDAISVKVPPPLNSASASCNAAGDQLTVKWSEPAPYTQAYVRLAPNSDAWNCLDYGFCRNEASGSSVTYAITPNATYHWWVQTEESGPGTLNSLAWSYFLDGTVTCTPPAPVSINLWPDDSTIISGNSTVLHWDINNATNCSGTNMPAGNWTSGGDGQATITPGSTTTYTLTCTGSGPSDTKQTTVNVSTTCAINLAKGGYGTVTSNPAGINCGTSCNSQSASFTCGPGKSVTLTPTASTNQKFVGWGGDCSGSGTGACTLQMNSAKNVTAIFTINPIFKEF